MGAPVLPCLMLTRRHMVKRYGIEEACCCSFLHVMCCPLMTGSQMLMEVEEMEDGQFGCCGRWTPTDRSDTRRLIKNHIR